MPINFPSSPALNSQYTYGGKTWSWNGYAWDIVTPTTISTLNGCTASAITITGTANEVTVDTTCPNIVIGLPNNLVVQNLTVTGNLLVSGGITTQMSEVVLIEDNFVTLNANVTAGAPTENAGIIISRGASANVDLRWNETSDNWQFTNNGTDYWNLPINVVNTFNGLTGAVSFAVPVASASVTGVASFTTADFTIGSTGNIGLTGTIARKNIDNGFSVGQSISSLGNSTTYGLGSISTQWSMNSYTLATPDETATVSLPSESGIIALVDGVVTRVNGATGAITITGAGAMLFTQSGRTGAFDVRLASSSVTGVASFGNEFIVSAAGAVGLTSNYVRTFNGLTGTVSFAVPVASASVTGVASFNATRFTVSAAGAVDLASAFQVTGDTVVAGNAITATRSDNSVTIDNNGVRSFNGSTGAVNFAVPVASASVTGVASFSNTHFVVSGAGAVSLATPYTVTGDTTIAGAAITISRSGNAATINNNGVISVNGSTGAVTGIATTSTNTFTGLQTMNAGLTANHLYVSNGATFTGTVEVDTGLILPNGQNITSAVTTFNGASGAVSFSTPLASSSVTGVASFGNEFVVSALGAVSLTSNYVKSINGSTGAITNVAKTNIDNGFTLRQSISDNLATNQVTVGGASIDFYYGVSENTQTLISSDSTSSISLPSTSGTLALVDGVATRVNGATGAVGMTGSGAILFTHSGKTGTFNARLASASATGVASFNVADFVVGSTGHVGLTGTVARKNSDNSFSTIQTFNAGISATGGLTAVGDYYIGSGSGAIRGIPAISYIVIGDESGINNGTQILIDDTSASISVKSPHGVIFLGDVDGVDTGNVLEINPSGSLISLFFPEVYTSGYMNAYEGYRIGSGAINAQTGTSYTLTGTDNGKIVTFNNGSAVTVTIPTGLPVGFNCTAIQLGAGQVGFTNAAGLTMQSYGNQYKMIGQHASATIIEYTTNIVNLSGNLIV